MSIIDVNMVNAWIDDDSFKFGLDLLNDNLAEQIEQQTFAILSPLFDTSVWVTSAATPSVVLSIIAMRYAGIHYQERYSSNGDTSIYGDWLIAQSNEMLASIVSRKVPLIGATVIASTITYSSGLSYEPVESDPKFSIDAIF